MSDTTTATNTARVNEPADHHAALNTEMAGQIVKPKSPYEMTVAELQAEIGKLQAILHYKVLSDPRERVIVSWARPAGQSETTA